MEEHIRKQANLILKKDLAVFDESVNVIISCYLLQWSDAEYPSPNLRPWNSGENDGKPSRFGEKMGTLAKMRKLSFRNGGT